MVILSARFGVALLVFILVIPAEALAVETVFKKICGNNLSVVVEYDTTLEKIRFLDVKQPKNERRPVLATSKKSPT